MGQDMMDTLYIRLGNDGMFFAACDGSRQVDYEIKTVPFKPGVSLNVSVHEALRSQPFASSEYREVRALCEGRATLVPLSEFDEDACEALYFFNFPGRRGRLRVFYDALPRQDAVLLFGVDKAVCRTLEEAFPQVVFQSVETPLLLHFAASSPRALPRRRLFVNLTAESMSVAACRSGRIELYNAFTLHHPEDALYYTLHVAKTWGFDASSDEVYVSGEAVMVDMIQKRTKAYLPNVFPVRIEEEFPGTPLCRESALPYDFVNLLLRTF